MKVDLIVFDMAGTTVDEDNVVYKTVRQALGDCGHYFTQDEVQAAGAGKEKSQAIRDVSALRGVEPQEEEVQRIFAHFKTLLVAAYRDLAVKEQAGAGEVFARLRAEGVRVVLNTGYDRVTAEGLLEKLNWVVGREIDGLVTASDVVRGRPHGDMIELAMERCGVTDSSRVAKVGDSQIDIEEGDSAGCGFTFGITTGAQTREQLALAHPTAIVDSLAEMVALLTD